MGWAVNRVALTLGSVLLVGVVIGVSSQFLPARSVPAVDAPPMPEGGETLTVRVGDEIPEEAALPPGFGRDCPRATPGWCVVTDQPADYSDQGLRAAREAAEDQRARREIAGGMSWFDAMALSQTQMRGLMLEPSSARYRNVWRVRIEEGDDSMWAFCGEVSGQNRFGGRSGFTRFIATPVLATVEGQAGFGRLYGEICVETPMVAAVPTF